MSTRKSDPTGLIFNIQKYSLHDGPGIRTTVFLKGCPLRCAWCSNPESQSDNLELIVNTENCLGPAKCRRCVDTCPEGAITQGPGDTIRIDRNRCRICAECAKACPNRALSVCGEVKSAAEVVAEVEKDGLFYARSGGGMTLSGGEPLHQPAFALALLKEAARRRIGTAVETCGYLPFEVLESACRWTRHLIYDIKTMDAAKHRISTGKDNRLILKNFRRIRKYYPELSIRVRTPAVPGFNDREADIRAILEFIREFPGITYELLPFHSLGSHKYGGLDRKYDYGNANLSETRFRRLSDVAETHRPMET